MRSSVLEHVVKHDEIVCLPQWNMGCAPQLCPLNKHVLNFSGSEGLLPVATVASSIDRMHFHTNFCCEFYFTPPVCYDFPLLVIVSDVIHLADMQLSYPLPPVMEILNNSKMWNCDRSSKTFSKRNAIERALAQERTDPKTRRRGWKLKNIIFQVWIATSCSSVQATSALDAVSGRLVQDAWTI
ncbi:hypothetical protein NC653_029921 [Populus alba x Populus x berolinensis]|uniref:Uncharacterized protein n=1 Tax=Populus alba x Populus x berolinensis TaxID=444605 RepID=A0AAD6M3E9_9ROSI|nr:hypothetical protein NC653_029921 [Populus alba x Populus x berolinensis]